MHAQHLPRLWGYLWMSQLHHVANLELHLQVSMSEQHQKKETVTEVKTYAVGEHLFEPAQFSRCKLHPPERQRSIV